MVDTETYDMTIETPTELHPTELHAVLYLVTKGISYETALGWSSCDRELAVIVFGELDGGEWDKDAQRWKKPQIHTSMHIDGVADVKRVTRHQLEASDLS